MQNAQLRLVGLRGRSLRREKLKLASSLKLFLNFRSLTIIQCIMQNAKCTIALPGGFIGFAEKLNKKFLVDPVFIRHELQEIQE